MQQLINEIISLDQKIFKEFNKYLVGQHCESHERLTPLASRMKSSAAYVVVAGSFNSGKSAFINSLLKDDICPVRANPSTSAITTIKHGKYAIYQILVGGGKRNITANKYNEMVTHKSGETNKTGQRRYEFEINHPADILRHIILVDTPGFNNFKNKYDENITKSFVTQADVILWLTDINALLKSSERQTLQSEEFVNPHGGMYLILNKADLKKDPKARNKIRLEAINEPHIGKLFQDVLIYSSDDVKNGQDDFAEEHRQLCELLIHSGKLAANYVEKSVRTVLNRYLEESNLILDRMSAQIPPYKSVFPYVNERADKLLAMMNERKKGIKTKAKDILKNCFDPVEAGVDEKDYKYIPYAKIEANTNLVELKKCISKDIFQNYNKKLQDIIIAMEGKGLCFGRIYNFDKDINAAIKETADYFKKTILLLMNKSFCNSEMDDYYYDLDLAIDALDYQYENNKGYFSKCANFTYDRLHKFVECSCESICQKINVLESKKKLNHPQNRFNNSMQQRKKIINCLKRNSRTT